MILILAIVAALQFPAPSPCHFAQQVKQLNLPPGETSNATDINHAVAILHGGQAVGWLVQTVKGQLFYLDGPIGSNGQRQPADALELPVTSVRIALGHSDFPAAPAQGNSATMASVGSAVHAACIAVREKIMKHASAQGDTYREIIARLGGEPVEAEVLNKTGDERSRFSMHGFGAIFVEVAVDPDLCMIHVRRVLGAYGAGRIINPRLARSQCIGGMVGAIGMALMERTIIDTRDGRLVNASMADYLVPVNLDIANLDALFVEEEDPLVNPLGVKGLGELAYVGVAPAIANAVFHATGQRVRDLPIHIEDLL